MPDRTITIGRARLTYYLDGAYTTFEDGTTWGAQPHSTPHYAVISHRCGYGDDILRYCREHEAAHHIVAEWIGGGQSAVLWALAHGEEIGSGLAAIEEMAAQTFQRWLRGGERPIIGGIDWDDLRARALTLLD